MSSNGTPLLAVSRLRYSQFAPVTEENPSAGQPSRPRRAGARPHPAGLGAIRTFL